MRLKGKISLNRQEWLSDLAESIANRFFDSNEPILPELISEIYGITYCYGEYGPYFDGMLECSDDHFHIYINTSNHNNEYRHRFTFAHELGHFFIDEHSIALAYGQTPWHFSTSGFISEEIVEREADYFAASLLMPQKRFLLEYQNYNSFSFKTLESLAQKFQVSVLATLFRFFYLDLHPLMLVKIVDGVIHDYSKSKNFNYYLKSKTIPKNSPAHLYIKEEKNSEKHSTLFANEWFDTQSNQLIHEFAIILDPIKTIYSVIWMN